MKVLVQFGGRDIESSTRRQQCSNFSYDSTFYKDASKAKSSLPSSSSLSPSPPLTPAKGFTEHHLKTSTLRKWGPEKLCAIPQHTSSWVTGLGPQPFCPWKHVLITWKTPHHQKWMAETPVIFSVRETLSDSTHTQRCFQALQAHAARLKLFAAFLLTCSGLCLQELVGLLLQPNMRSGLSRRCEKANKPDMYGVCILRYSWADSTVVSAFSTLGRT